ncbi:MAG: hypothetical protein PHX61_00735 [Alphaproteobacteria bacterium]|nr:hypothetical protein [Alphaproteobacteria bacterium]
MSESECQSLPVWCDGKQCVSCWKPTIADRIRIALGGNIWLGVMSGNTQPPVFISGEQVFAKASIKARFLAFVAQTKESIIDAVNNVKDGFKQPDKRKHFIVGLAISLLVGVFLPLLGVLVGCIAGAFKEWWDSKGHGTVELMDFLFTVLGSLCAFPFAWFINFLIW